jgi:hypothetical protein
LELTAGWRAGGLAGQRVGRQAAAAPISLLSFETEFPQKVFSILKLFAT